MNNLVYTQLETGLPIEMLADSNLLIISDGGIFVVATKQDAEKYKLPFEPIPKEAIDSYNISISEGLPIIKE